VYGGLRLELPLEAQLRRLLVLVASALALQAFISSPTTLMAFAFVAGICIAPTLTVTSMLIASCTPARHATEAFTWATTSIVAGLGAGNALGGLLLQHAGPAPVFAMSALAAAAAAAGARVLRIPSSLPSPS
ncbi:MAG: MFS transporter, partial [Casimicrobiaceae bacterium]